MEKHKSIKNWAEDEKPREKVLSKGMQALSDSELIAILINNGTKNKSALDLAKEVYALAGNNFANLGALSVQDICKNIKGIGIAKAVSICSALEIGRRRQIGDTMEKKFIRNSKDAVALLQPLLQDKNEEQFAVIYLNAASSILHYEIVAIGGLTSCIVDMRVIFKKALELQAVQFIIAHNHPSGNPSPSAQDGQITAKIKEAGALLQINLRDHIIITNNLTYSFADTDNL
jgi:DNA repair protein RadC